MNEDRIERLEEAIKRLHAIIDGLKPIRDVLLAGDPERAEIDQRLRTAQADNTDAAFELAHLKTLSHPVEPLTDEERTQMRRQLEELDARLRDVQTVQAWIAFADALVTVVGEQRGIINKPV
jgi:hypothetical protein